MQKAKTVFLEWQPALKLAILIALIQRIFFQLWMGGVFAVIKNFQLDTGYHYLPADKRLPFLESDISRVLFEIWRRWDAVHYLNLAENGYEATDPKPTIFPPLTSVGIRVFDLLTPGGVDIGGMIYSTVFFIIFLTLLYRFCELYYQNTKLATASIYVVAFLPSAYFWNAPMSEPLFMALLMAFFLAVLSDQWKTAFILGILVTLARQQAMVIGGIAFLMLLEKKQPHHGIWIKDGWDVFKKVWPLVLLPLAWWFFLQYRDNLGIMPFGEAQKEFYGASITDPLTAIISHIKITISNPRLLFYPDFLAMWITFILAFAMLFFSQHRRFPMVVYTFGYMLVFVSIQLKVSEDISVKVSYLRQTMVLFPLWIFVADRLLHGAKPVRLLYIAFIFAALLILSAAHSLGGGVS